MAAFISLHSKGQPLSHDENGGVCKGGPFIGVGLWNEELDAALGAMCISVVFPFWNCFLQAGQTIMGDMLP